MKEQESLLLSQQAEVVTIKEIGLVVVKEVEQIFDETVEEEAAMVIVVEKFVGGRNKARNHQTIRREV